MGQLSVQGPVLGGWSRWGGRGGSGRGLLLLGCPVSSTGGVHQGVLVIFSPGCPFQVGFPRGHSGRSACGACVGGPVLSCKTMVWPRVQLCRVRTRAAAASLRVAAGGASDSWMKTRASFARGAPARFVNAPVLVSRPCTTTLSGDCCWAFSCFRRSWMYAPGSRLLPVSVIRWSVSLSARYRLYVGRWCASAATCSTRWMLSCSGSLSRSKGMWFAETSRPLASDSRGESWASGGAESWECVSIAVPVVVLDTDSGASCAWSSGSNVSVCGPGPRELSQSSWRGEACCSGPCFGGCTPCGRGCGLVRGSVAVVCVL